MYQTSEEKRNRVYRQNTLKGEERNEWVNRAFKVGKRNAHANIQKYEYRKVLEEKRRTSKEELDE